MANIRTWSTTASSNNQATPDGFPEGMSPSSLNDTCRELMAALRTWYQDAEWIDWGHAPTRVADTQFSVATDQTAVYTVGRRVRIVGSTTGYGYITASSYGAPNTTITVSWDSGTTPTSPTAASVGLLTPVTMSAPRVGGINVERITSTQGLTPSAANVVLFNGENLDTSGAYDTATGAYAAPVAGLYLFTSCVILQNNASGSAVLNDIYFRKNLATTQGNRFSLSMPVVRGGSVSAGSNAFNNTGSVLVHLAAGENIYVVVDLGSVGGSGSVTVNTTSYLTAARVA